MRTFDTLPTLTRNDLLDEVQRFVFDHGHELADAVRLIGGAAAEVRVISLALCLERASSVDDGIRQELSAGTRGSVAFRSRAGRLCPV